MKLFGGEQHPYVDNVFTSAGLARLAFCETAQRGWVGEAYL